MEDLHFIDNISSEQESLFLDAILNHSSEWIYFKDLESRFVLVNKVFLHNVGAKNIAEVIGKTDYDFFEAEHADEALSDEKRIIETHKPMLVKTEKEVRKDGKIKWVSTSKYPFYDADGNVIGTWGITRDITHIKLAQDELEDLNRRLQEANRKLEILSAKDSLSDLYNHRYFYEETEREFQLVRRQRLKDNYKCFSVLIFDIDHFKDINDTYGHLTGDYTIRTIADLIKRSIRATDTAFRHGGDEFAILLRDTNLEEAKVVADKIHEIILNSPVVTDKGTISITISGGIASSDEAYTVNSIVEIADKRLYVSKTSGRNRITKE